MEYPGYSGIKTFILNWTVKMHAASKIENISAPLQWNKINRVFEFWHFLKKVLAF